MEDLKDCIECFQRVDETSKYYCDTRFGTIINEYILYPPYRNRIVFRVFPVKKYLGSTRTDDIFRVTIESNGVQHTIPVFYFPKNNTFVCRDYDPSVIIPNILAESKHSDFLQSKLHPMYKFGYVADYSSAPRDADWHKRYLPRNMMSDERMRIRENLDMDIIYEDDTPKPLVPKSGVVEKPNALSTVVKPNALSTTAPLSKPGIQTISGPPLKIVQQSDGSSVLLTDHGRVPAEQLSDDELKKACLEKTSELQARVDNLENLDAAVRNLVGNLSPDEKNSIIQTDPHVAELISAYSTDTRPTEAKTRADTYKQIILGEMDKLGIKPGGGVQSGGVQSGVVQNAKATGGFTIEMARALGYDPKDFLSDQQLKQMLPGRVAESEDDVKHDAAYYAARGGQAAIHSGNPAVVQSNIPSSNLANIPSSNLSSSQLPRQPMTKAQAEAKVLRDEIEASVERMRQLQEARQMHEYAREEHRQLLRETRRVSPHPLDGTLDFNPDFTHALTPGFAGTTRRQQPDLSDNIEWVINHASPVPVHTGRVQEPDTDTSDGCSCTASGECAAHDVNRDYDPEKDPDLAGEMIDMFGDVAAQVDEPSENILEPEDEDKPINCVCERPGVISAECNAHDTIIRRPPRKLTHAPRMSYEDAMATMQKERYEQHMRTYDLARTSLQETSDLSKILDSNPKISTYNQRIRKELEELEEAKKLSLEYLTKQIDSTIEQTTASFPTLQFPNILFSGEPVMDLPSTDVPKLPEREDNL